ncbi:unnamed protein product [Lactuca virosa]|uniref:Uncharacterized protein n=1 Tax=Lactuca virosa TaxID=75947 RepID=A0AAU9N0I3_9ASTR|nr:unnamed protein product [Lactuca virosa]
MSSSFVTIFNPLFFRHQHKQIMSSSPSFFITSKKRLRENHIRAASATILTYGSYSLAVYNVENDIDALCAGPWFAYLTEVG